MKFYYNYLSARFKITFYLSLLQVLTMDTICALDSSIAMFLSRSLSFSILHIVRTLPTALYIRCLESCLTTLRSLRYLFAVTVATLDQTSFYFASSSSRRVYFSSLIFSSSSIISEIEIFAYPSLSRSQLNLFSLYKFSKIRERSFIKICYNKDI